MDICLSRIPYKTALGTEYMKKRLFSGIQPSGDIHIGNYLGALKNWVAMARQYDSIFCVVDYHAITIPYDTAGFRSRILHTAAMLMAVGLKPEECKIFVQSHVPEHTELCWVLSTVIQMGHLERMIQYKEKSKQHAENINVGLFTYPVLQAADILIYKAEVVPVGEDQIQHIELSREIARKFNTRFGPIFPEPLEKVSAGARIMGLDGQAKMSKSLGNTIALTDTPEIIHQKLKTAVTDVNRKRRSDTGNPDVCNLFTLHKYFSGSETVDEINKECRNAGIGCIDCKTKLAAHMSAELNPIRERYNAIVSHTEDVVGHLESGANQCREMARQTMGEVRSAIGIR